MLENVYSISELDREVFLKLADTGKNKAKAQHYDDMPYAYIGYLEGLVAQAVNIIQNAKPVQLAEVK